MLQNDNPPRDNDLGIEAPDGAALAQRTAQADPDLAAVVLAWPTLPEAVRAGILAMVEASRGRDAG